MVCKNCGADDLMRSDLCGDYCVYCLNFEEMERKVKKNESERANRTSTKN